MKAEARVSFHSSFGLQMLSVINHSHVDKVSSVPEFLEASSDRLVDRAEREPRKRLRSLQRSFVERLGAGRRTRMWDPPVVVRSSVIVQRREENPHALYILFIYWVSSLITL